MIFTTTDDNGATHGSRAIVSLKGGASATATGLPVGTYYKVTEVNADDFELTGITVNGTKNATATEAKGVISATASSGCGHTSCILISTALRRALLLGTNMVKVKSQAVTSDSAMSINIAT